MVPRLRAANLESLTQTTGCITQLTPKARERNCIHI